MPDPAFSLDKKITLVVGAANGIGRATALAYAAAGAAVTCADVEEPGAKTTAADIEAAGGQALPVRLDVTDGASCRAAVAATVARFGGLDVLINNAGVGIFTEVGSMTPDQWSEVIDTNLTGVFNACQSALPHLRRRGGGYIINISSLAGKNPFKGAGAYCASKAALNAFSEVLMQEVRYDNIRVSYVMPGSVATGFSSGDETKGADWKSSPDDVADAVMHLLRSSPQSIQSRVEIRPSQPRK
jgi:NAD(P)-dependent dehydrogenase (short-subunit alcohol dehydrogenase family)